jgi:hypothetical protein
MAVNSSERKSFSIAIILALPFMRVSYVEK